MTIKTLAIRMMAIMVFALTLGACSENENEMPDTTTPDGEKITFTASLSGVDTRLSHTNPTENGVTVSWTEQDVLKLFPTDGSAALGTYTVVAGSIINDGKTATFTGDPLPGTDNYYLYGPAHGDKIPDNENGDGYDFFFNFQGQKQIGNNTLGHLKDYNLIKAVVTNGDMSNLSFEHKVALFQFTLTGLPAGTYNNFAIQSDQQNSIIYQFSEEGNLGETNELSMELEDVELNAGDDLVLWMMMPAGHKLFKEATLTLAVTNADNKTYVNTTAIEVPEAGLTYTAGQRYSMSTPMQLQLNLSAEAQRFVEWGQNGGWMNGGFELAEDIDITGVNWIPQAVTDGFAYIFEGNQHTITGLDVNTDMNEAGLFGIIAATGIVRNVTLKGNIKGKQNIGSIAGTNLGIISNCTFEGEITASSSNVGGIAGANKGLVVGCRVTQSSITGTNQVGGIVGTSSTGYCNIACLADGVTLEATKASGNAYIGGIAGYNYASYTVACVTAPVSMSGPSTSLKPGGIIGDNYNGGIAITNYWQTDGSGYSSGIGSSGTAMESYCYPFSGNFPSEGIDALNTAISNWNTDHPDKICNFEWVAGSPLPTIQATSLN